MSENQKKFDQMSADIAAIRKELPAIVKNEVMGLLNYKVRDYAGEDKSIFDLVRDGGGIGRELPWYGFDGKPQPDGGRQGTTLATDTGWQDSRIAHIGGKLDQLIALVTPAEAPEDVKK